MLVNRNITVGSLRTSVRLEPQFWEALSDIAVRERLTTDRLCTMIDANAGELGRTAAIRVFIASYFAEIRTRENLAATANTPATIEQTSSFRAPYIPAARAVG